MRTIASILSSGKSSIGDTCWMPALLIAMSIRPVSATARSISAAIWSGLVMSAASYSAVAPLVAASSARIASMASASPNPLMTRLAPSAASAFA